jgi:sulfoxide reductase heme-binding subunit YedZ
VSRQSRIVLKSVVWIVCLLPLLFLLYWTYTGDLTANPISFITNHLGQWTFRLLLASLAMTPLRVLFGFSWPISLRRLLGLFAFSYACLHFSVWIVIDHFFDWNLMFADILKRRYITVGMLALTLLVPLAVTSTSGMVKRLGGANWRRLHRLVYVTGILASLHFLWLAKVGRSDQYLYAAILALLLGIRIWDAIRRAVRRARQGGPARSAALSLQESAAPPPSRKSPRPTPADL